MISVIIPAYNVEKYITDCLKSIERQSYKDLEVVIVDDGSTDATLSIINNYLATTSLKMTVLSQSNAGVSAARNLGIQNAHGEYYSFIDSDDILHPDYFKKQLQNIFDYDADISIIARKNLSEDAHEYVGDSFDQEVNIYTRDEALSDLLYVKIKVGIPSVMCKKETLGSIRFAVGVAYGEDLEVLWKLVSVSNKVVYDHNPLYGYRIRESSAMGKMSPKRVAGMRLFEQLEGYFMNENPEFAPLFCKYGVARWVWATMWQAAVAATSYRNFKESMSAYSPKERMLKLLKYPDFKVRCSSLLYVISPFLYYCFVKAIRKKLRNVS